MHCLLCRVYRKGYCGQEESERIVKSKKHPLCIRWQPPLSLLVRRCFCAAVGVFIFCGRKKLPLISETGNQGELMLYLCFFKRSRKTLRRFLCSSPFGLLHGDREYPGQRFRNAVISAVRASSPYWQRSGRPGSPWPPWHWARSC